MSVLLMRLAGPMQSWGTRSRFTNRDTGLEPSKSGVIGLLCAALGWPRGAETFELASKKYTLEEFARSLVMAVRVDREGRLMRDYHTAQRLTGDFHATQAVRPPDSKSTHETVLSERFYLSDADFLVGLGGDRALLKHVDAKLRAPTWTLYLGRKSFLPSLPIAIPASDGEAVQQDELLPILSKHPWRMRHAGDKPAANKLRGIREVPYGTGEPRQDVPLSFASRDRRFAVRHVKDHRFPIPDILEPISETPHVPQQAHSQHS